MGYFIYIKIPRCIPAVFLLVLLSPESRSQARLTLVPDSSRITSMSFSQVKDPNPDTAANCPPPESVAVNPGTQLLPTGIPGRFWGGATSYIQRGVTDSSCFISAQGTANVQVRDDNSSTIYVQWWCHSNTQFDCLHPHCAWFANDTSSLDARVALSITGVPAGTPVKVSYRWAQFFTASSMSEAAGEDSAFVTTSSLNLFNRDGFNWAPAQGAPVQRFSQTHTGRHVETFNAQGGDLLTIDVSSSTAAYIYPPPVTPANPREDDASADFFGYAIISVSTAMPPPGPPDTCLDGALHFSVDIGSDAELSDPTPDGNEVMDPGDLYTAGPASPVPFFNDSLLFNADPRPAAGNPAGTCAPGPLQQWQHVLNFDLDGVDRVDYDLSANPAAYGPGRPSVPFYATDCIYPPDFLILSYDEDRGIPFSSAVNCNVPAAFAAQDSVLVKGTITGHDEIMGANLVSDSAGGQYMGMAMPLLNEAEVSALLSPAPASGYPPDRNDDVDALDLAGAGCGHPYFSVDHEAHYIRQGDTLRPGFIYQYISPDSIRAAITPSTHLGLSDAIDIDAFEFAWLWDTAAGRSGLALVFSVAVNDPFDVTDYTGGLSPGALYASFLNGAWFPLLPPIRPGNIDAISFACKPRVANGAVFMAPNLSVGAANEAPWLVRLYPNPNDGSFTLEFTLDEPAMVQATVADAVGHTVWTGGEARLQQGKQHLKIRTSSLAAGIYFTTLCIRTADGTRLIRRKVQILH